MISTSIQRVNLPQSLLMAHFSQTLLPFVRRHLVAFTFFTAGHETSFPVPLLDAYWENECCCRIFCARIPSSVSLPSSTARLNHMLDSSRLLM
jgi:hypothetical protein